MQDHLRRSTLRSFHVKGTVAARSYFLGGARRSEAMMSRCRPSSRTRMARVSKETITELSWNLV